MPFILGTNSIKDTGYNVANSLRFNSGSSDYLNKTLGTATNRKKFTYSFWFKKSSLTGNQGQLITAGTNGNNADELTIHSSDKLSFQGYESSTQEFQLRTNALFRDVSAWYHVVVAYDSTQGTASNRIKMYVNGTQVTSFAIETYPDENHEPLFNSNIANYLGTYINTSGYFYDGYMAEVVFIDGQQLDATSFGEFDSDSPTIWKPIDVSGLTFGTNGFYLDFENASSLGADVSGNSNNFTVNNLTSIDQSTDTCTNNFATLNPLLVPLSYIPTYAEGNLQISAQSNSGRFQSISTIGVNSGKWYAEFRVDSSQYHTLGVCTEASFTTASTLIQDSNNYLGQSNTLSYIYYNNDGDVWSSGTISSGYGASLTSVGDILGVALDLDNHKLYFSKNGTFQNSGDPTSGSTGTGAISIPTGHTYFFAVGDLATGSFSGTSVNFGSPSFAISSGNADANGHGNFEYSVPSGYFSLNTKNLAEFG